jgi:hypothetical protein
VAPGYQLEGYLTDHTAKSAIELNAKDVE